VLRSPARLAVALACTLLAAARLDAASWSVPLALSEPEGIARRREPVTLGVPLPAGALRADEPARVETAGGIPVPAATRLLERWPDGSTRWLLVDFLADAEAWGTTRYRVRPGAPAAPERGLRVERVDGGWDVDTGVVRLRVPSDGETLVADLRRGDDVLVVRVPLPTLVRADGVSSATRRTRTTIESKGPIRTEFLVDGTYGNGLAFEFRLAVFAGSGTLRLQHTVIDRTETPPYVPIRALELRVPAAITSARLGRDLGADTIERPGPTRRLWQHGPTAYRLDDEPHDGRGAGWVDGRVGGGGHVTLVSRYFWEEYPQAVAAGADGLSLALVAAPDEPLLLGRGAAKTHELWLVASSGGAGHRPEELATTLQRPLLAAVDAAWTVGTGADRMTVAPGEPAVDGFLDRLKTGLTTYRSRVRAERWDDGEGIPCASRGPLRIRTGFYGALNWGDWNFPGLRDETKGCDAWGNLEYDLALSLGLGWLATGDPHFHDAFVPAARHYRDVDIIHFAPDHPDRLGLNHPHKVRHFAPEAPNSVDLGHTWLDGLVLHHRLTGEVRSLKAAHAMGDQLVTRLGKASNPRHFGWPLIALATLIETEGGGRFREPALTFAGRAMDAFPPTPLGVDWKVGILADGIAAVHAVTSAPALREWLVRYAEAMVANAASPAVADARYAQALGYVSGLTGDARQRELALTTAKNLEIGGWGKTLAADGRVGFRLLGALAPEARRDPAAPRRE
jgi:hypothetical protein